MFKPALNITEQIADYLAERIICGELSGGSRIQEIKVAKSLSVSRGSIREALLILERRHLIELVPRKGAVVNALSAVEALELIDMLATLERRWFTELASRQDRDRVLTRAAPQVAGMEQASRNQDLGGLVHFRGLYYVALLTGASRYTAALFESLLPTSQRILHQLLNTPAAKVDGYDVARYYKALHEGLVKGSAERIDELVGAFRKRVHNLSAEVFARPVRTANPPLAAGWTQRTRVDAEPLH